MSPDTATAEPTDLAAQLAAIKADADARRAARPAGYGMLRALQAKHVYAGTVDPAEVARRRRRNKAARIARRAAR